MKSACVLIALIMLLGSCSTKKHDKSEARATATEAASSDSASNVISDSATIPRIDSETSSGATGSDSVSDTGSEPGSDSGSDSDPNSNSDTGSDSESDTGKDSGLLHDECIPPVVVEACADGFCRIPPGCYMFGSPPTETPTCRAFGSEDQVQVTLTRSFLIAQTEVTQLQWEEMGFPNPSPPPVCSDCPVSMVTWFETLAYCNALSAKEGLENCYDLSLCDGAVSGTCLKDFCGSSDGFICRGDVNRFANPYECQGYRLPTNAEWQLAARAGTTTATYNGDLVYNDISLSDCSPVDAIADEIAWNCSNTTHAMPVGLKKKNGLGLYDMLGNLLEWSADPWQNTRLGGGDDALIDPYGFVQDETVNDRPVSGGNWLDPSCLMRAAWNPGTTNTSRMSYVGFRPVRTLFE